MIGHISIVSVFHVIVGLALLTVGFRTLTVSKSSESGHTRLGEVYFWLLAVTCASALLIGLRDPAISVFEIATPPTFASGLLGYVMAKRRPRGWLRWHIIGQAGSFIGVNTALGFQIFPRLLPEHPLLFAAYWLVPVAVGSALTASTLRRWRPRIAMARG